MSCKKLIKPSELIEKYPNDIKDFILQSRKTIKDIIFKKDEKFLVIVGPCSIHDIDQ
jgi:3-deoxy-7-phosphoheptulonate synthase